MENLTDKNCSLSGMWILRLFGRVIVFGILLSLFLVPLIFTQNNISTQQIQLHQMPFFSGSKLLLLAAIVVGIPLFIAAATVLLRINLHFSLEEKFFVLKEGVIGKRQRNIPYSVIQDVLIKTDFWGRIFGYSTVIFENASGSGKNYIADNRKRGKNEIVGSRGNKIFIPGLKKEDAEKVKTLLFKKIQENPARETGGGM